MTQKQGYVKFYVGLFARDRIHFKIVSHYLCLNCIESQVDKPLWPTKETIQKFDDMG